MSKWALVIQSTRGRGGRKTRAPLRNCSPTGALLIPLHFIPTGALRKKTYSRSHFHRYWNLRFWVVKQSRQNWTLSPSGGTWIWNQNLLKSPSTVPSPSPFLWFPHVPSLPECLHSSCSWYLYIALFHFGTKTGSTGESSGNCRAPLSQSIGLYSNPFKWLMTYLPPVNSGGRENRRELKLCNSNMGDCWI